MMKKLIASALASIFGHYPIARGSMKVEDISYTYRMGAGFAGDANRAHPVSIEPTVIDPANPTVYYGNAVIASGSTNDVRAVAAGDTALTDVYGFAVRPFPIQQQQTTNYGGSASIGGQQQAPSNQPLDVIRMGYFMGQLNLVTGNPAATKGGTVYIWVAATSGQHIQGNFETQATGGSTITLAAARYEFNGPPDSTGITEIYCR